MVCEEKRFCGVSWSWSRQFYMFKARSFHSSEYTFAQDFYGWTFPLG
jgi:hypothetical protein